VEPGAGDVVLDVGVDSAQGCPEFGWGLGLVGGQQRPQEPVVQLGVEDRGATAVRGQDVVVVRNAAGMVSGRSARA